MRSSRGAAAWALALALVLPAFSRGEEPPSVDHQPVPCTVPAKAIALCATVTGDNDIAKARIYFRRTGEEFYSVVDMAFGGLNYCGTVPAPRAGKVQSLDYYIQAVDQKFLSTRTSTFQLPVKAEESCEFPPVEKDAARVAAITVYATSKKQGRKLDEAFESAGVTFVPITTK